MTIMQKANLAGFFAILIFAVGSLIYALSDSIPSFQFLSMIFLIGGSSLLVFQKLRGHGVRSQWRQPLSSYALLLFGVGVYNVLLLIAFRHAPDFEVNTLNYLWPILIVTFASVFNKSKLTPPIILGLIMGFVGTALLFLPDQNADLFSFELGHILSIIAAITWALYSVFAKRHDYPAGFLGPIMIICGVIYFCLHLMFEETVMPSLVMLVVIILFGLSRFCYALWDYAMQKGDQILVSTASYFTPLISTLLFIVFGLKPSSPYVAVAGGLIVLGCLTANAPKIFKTLRKLRDDS